MTAIFKICPRCAHKAEPRAVLCRSCGHGFTDAEQRSFEANAAKLQAEISRKNQLGMWGCVGLAAAFAFAIMIAGAVHRATATPDQLKAEKIANCFGGFDGRNVDLVQKVEANLREPESFEHIETRFAPSLDATSAAAEMRYRARNGLGGMDVATVQATIDAATCEATITSYTDS